MKRLPNHVLFVLLLLLAFVLVACNGEQQVEETDAEVDTVAEAETAAEEETVAEEETAAEEETTAETETVANSDELELSEKYSFDDFGYSIVHPVGWVGSRRGTVSILNELETDHETAFRDDSPPREGYEVTLDHRGMAFMRTIGLPEEAALQDLFDFNKEFFEWQEPIDVTEIEVFGAPALAVMTEEGSEWTHTVMGITNDEFFLLGIGAPSEEALEEILPTWERMLASIEAE